MLEIVKSQEHFLLKSRSKSHSNINKIRTIYGEEHDMFIVPAIKDSQQKSKGKAYNGFVELVDLFPTVTELAGLVPVDSVQGISLVSLLNNPKAKTERIDAYSMTTDGHCLRSGKWAYMWYPKRKKNPEGFQLFDMEKDSEQHTNLVDNADYKSIRETLHKRLLERIKDSEN